MNGKRITDKKLLIVDDCLATLSLFKICLRDIMPVRNIYTAKNIEEADDVLDSRDIDLIFLDMVLPGRNGADFIVDFRGKHSNDGAPVVVVTATSPDSLIKYAISKYASGFIHKPITKNQLLNIAVNHLNGNHE